MPKSKTGALLTTRTAVIAKDVATLLYRGMIFILLRGVLPWAGPALARRRQVWLVRRLAGACTLFLRNYYNVNYEQETNGEQRVMRLLRGAQEVRYIFDVGANVGDWALRAHAAFPEASLHCFEIAPDTCAILRERVGSLPGVFVSCHGLSDREGEITVRYVPGATQLTSTVAVPPGVRSVEVQGTVIRGDTYAASNGIAHIDFVKVDVEGAEQQVLLGFHALLGGGAIDVLQFEYGRVNIVSKFLLRDAYLLFTDYGYRVGKIYPTYVDFRDYQLDDEDFRGPNYLAVRADRADLLKLLGGL